MGADFSCYAEENKLVAEKLKFENVYYKHYYMSTQPSWGAYLMFAKEGPHCKEKEFDVYQVPGSGDESYMINPSLRPEWLLGIWKGKNDPLVQETSRASHFSPSLNPFYMKWHFCRTSSGTVRFGILDETSWYGGGNGILWAYTQNNWLNYGVEGWSEHTWSWLKAKDTRAEWRTDESFTSKLSPCSD